MQPMIGVVSSIYGIPSGFWQDDFVLGFLFLTASFHINHTSGIALSQEDKGQVLVDVFSRLSNMNGSAIVREATNAAYEGERRPKFKKGGDNAHICCFVSLGKVTDAGRSEVEAAKKAAIAMGLGTDLSAITGTLFQRLYAQPIAERFDLRS
jgi:hypothetical protein